jgi:predicted phosphodiesterase
MKKGTLKNLFCLLIFLLWAPVTTAADRVTPLPYLGRLTSTSAVLNILLGPEGSQYFVRYRLDDPKQAQAWQQSKTIVVEAGQPVQWTLDGLLSGRVYQYGVWYRTHDQGEYTAAGTHTFQTRQRVSGPFAFALFSDAHIAPGQYERMEVLSRISTRITHKQPDFVIMLGDNIQTFDSHGGPMEKPVYGSVLYHLFRQSLGDLPAGRPCYFVNGNWEGENGWHPDHQRLWARDARQRYIPNPVSTTYPQGGSDGGDYYAFTWGEMLCIVLNVTGYTPDDHGHSSKIGRRDNWTLGKEQKAWLYQTLKRSHEPLKAIFIHHPAGGGSPDDINARYGRGGGLAARVGEQAELHQWMRTFGVQALFYGHDHVFTDTVVDDIHYICVGSAGAPWKFTRDETGYERYWAPSGYTWVDVSDNRMAVSFIDSNDRVLHHFLVNGMNEHPDDISKQ